MKKSANGFTIVELLVVIAIVGILATIATVSLSGVQVNARDTQRKSKASLIAEALEKYYSQNGEYPSCEALSQSPQTVVSNTLKSVDVKTLYTPSDPEGTNSIVCSNTTSDKFIYKLSCTKYAFTYNSSNGPSTISGRYGASGHIIFPDGPDAGSVSTTGECLRTHIFNPRAQPYNLTAAESGTIDISIQGAGGGGGGGSYYCDGGPGENGGTSSITFEPAVFSAIGGQGGSNCSTPGDPGGVNIINAPGFTNIANPTTGGGSPGGNGSNDWLCPQCDPTPGGNGGNGGFIKGILQISSGQSLTIIVGNGGAGGLGNDTVPNASPGGNGKVVISYY